MEENWKEKYEQALATAKDMLDHTAEDYRCVNFTKDDLRNLVSHMFPQLQLSRDEQIRRALIKYHKNTDVDALDDFSEEEIVEYLERQKPVEHDDDYRTNITLMAKYFEGKSSDDDTNFADKKVFKRWAEILGMDGKINSLTMNGESVPTETQSVDISAGRGDWTEIDENRYNFLMYMILESDENFATKNGLKNWLEDKLRH